MEVEQVLAEIRGLAATYKEIVLTGINLGRWGREAGFRAEARMRLSGLLRRILDETGVERLRVSSVEPMDLTGELLAVMASTERIAAHVHAPLQSGSDAVLKRMRRRYRVRHYEERLMEAHALLPEAAFGADVMTGFPGETDEEFQETHELIARLPLTYLHVFTYSSRPGTPAAELPQVPVAVRKARTRALRALAAEKNLQFRRAMVGRTLSAVTLDGNRALTSNFLNVELARARAANELIAVKIGEVTANGVAEAGRLNIL